MVARLEAFSDIVIGFSLAQASINLVANNSSSFFLRPLGIIAYLITFFLVARVWWEHSQIMRRYFELNRIMVTLNFVALAGLGLMIFSLQMWIHRGMSDVMERQAIEFYFLCFALTYGATAAMRGAGVFYRWEHLEPEERRSAMSRSLVTGIVCVAVVVSVFLPSPDTYFGVAFAAPVPMNVFVALFGGAIVGRLSRLLLERSRFGANA